MIDDLYERFYGRLRTTREVVEEIKDVGDEIKFITFMGDLAMGELFCGIMQKTLELNLEYERGYRR